MLFPELVREFESFAETKGFATATLYVNSLAAQVTVRYLPDGDMEIRGLPGDMPPYLLFSDDEVYFDVSKKLKAKDEEEKSFYGLYRTWDPRVVVKGYHKEEHTSGRRGTGSYYIEKAIFLHSEIKKRLGPFLEQEQQIEFVSDGNRLLEISECDFSRYPTKLSLVFVYSNS